MNEDTYKLADGCTVAYDDFTLGEQYPEHLGLGGWNTVVRINQDSLTKQRTMTKAEVVREFGVVIVD